MLTSEGYYPFSALLSDALGDILFTDAETYLLENTKTAMSLATGRRDDLVLNWVLDYCGTEMFVCSNSGQILQIDEKVLKYNNYFVDITSHLMAGDDATIVPKSLRDDFNFCEPMQETEIHQFNDLVSEYYELDDDAQEAAEKKIREHLRRLIESDGFTRPPLFFEPFSGKIDLRLFEYLSNTGVLEAHFSDSRGLLRTARELQRVEGWTLAVPISLLGKAWEDFCKDRASKHQKYMDGLLADDVIHVGRPRKQEQAAKVFKELYPKGIGKATWVQAAYRISKVTGESVSVDTLKRALRKK